MIDPISPKPTGSTPEALFDQETHDRTRGPESRIRNTSTIRVEYKPNGIFLHGKPGKGGASTPTPPITNYTIVPCNLPSSGNITFSDYIVVQDDNGHYWPVAKPWQLRCSIVGKAIEGTSITYSYNGTAALVWQRRTASPSGLIEGITPPYVISSTSPSYPGDRIAAYTPSNGTGVTIASGDTTGYGPSATAWTAGTAVTLQEDGIHSRAWSVLVNQTGEGS